MRAVLESPAPIVALSHFVKAQQVRTWEVYGGMIRHAY